MRLFVSLWWLTPYNFFFIDDLDSYDDTLDELDESDSDNDLEAIRQVLPTPSEIRQMSDDDALTWLRTLLPDNILSDQLESVSHTFILIPKMFLNFLSEEIFFWLDKQMQ